MAVKIEQRSTGQIAVNSGKCVDDAKKAYQDRLETAKKNRERDDALTNQQWGSCCGGLGEGQKCGNTGDGGKPCFSDAPTQGTDKDKHYPIIPSPPGCCCTQPPITPGIHPRFITIVENTPMSCAKAAKDSLAQNQTRENQERGAAESRYCSDLKKCGVKALPPGCNGTSTTQSGSGTLDGGVKGTPITNLTTINNLNKTDYLNIGLDNYSALLFALQQFATN
jgi:hypothetical protein